MLATSVQSFIHFPLSFSVSVLPDEYISAMSALTDRAESLPWEEISEVLKEDFCLSGQSLNLKEIDKTAIAAAVRER